MLFVEQPGSGKLRFCQGCRRGKRQTLWSWIQPCLRLPETWHGHMLIRFLSCLSLSEWALLSHVTSCSIHVT